MKLKAMVTAVAISPFSSHLIARKFKIGDVIVCHLMAFEMDSFVMAGEFLTIRNNGTETVQLIAVSARLPQLWIHRTAVTDAIANILPVEISKLYPETQSRLNHAALT